MSEYPDVYRYLDQDGLLSEAFEGYEFRQGQLDMALLVQKAYEEDSIAVIEAGTGIGKSFAYLVPALINARKGEELEKTVIATATKNLQMQLSKKDIPQLFKAGGQSCAVSLLFGRSNYVCLRRLEEAMKDIPLFADDEDVTLSRFRKFVSETDSGLFQDYPYPLNQDVYNATFSDADLCQGHRCPFIRECFYQKAKHEALKADILITNHHLLFTDAARRDADGADFSEDGVLPPYSRLVIDEAHNIEQNATELFSGVYSSFNVSRQLGFMLRARFNSKQSLLETLTPFCSRDGLADSIREKANALNLEMGTLDMYLSALIADKAPGSRSILIQKPDTPVLAEFRKLAGNICSVASQLVLLLQSFSKALKMPDGEDMAVQEFDTLTNRVHSCFDTLSEFIDLDHWTDDVHFIRETQVKRERVFEVCISPISIADRLRDGLFAKLKTVICTSATLNLNDNFAYWGSRVGLPVPDRGYLTMTAPSPFDFRHNLLLLTPSDAPEFTEKVSQKYLDYNVDAIRSAVLSSNGGALILFTNRSMMEYVHSMLKDELQKQGIRAMVQGELDRFHLLSAFKQDPDSVLFATSSFWEGIDAPGNTLRLVIIVKIPFPSPAEPINKARSRKIENEGGSGFFNLLLPEATMKLKQGFGRLIRSATDKGIVLILDSRIVTKGYGASMIRALPESYHPDTDTSGICDKIESFLYS